MLWSGLFLVLGPLRSPGDGDLFWQRWLGDLVVQTHRLPSALGAETFTAQGAPWVPQEWLFSTLLALAWNAHLFFLFSLAVSALPAIILATIYWRSRGGASPEAIGIALLLCGIALLESFGVRAQVLGWAMLAAFMLFVERRDRWYYLTIPAAVLWANVHASVAIAPVIVLSRVVATIADGGMRALGSSRDAVALPAVLLASVCTPLGWKLPLLAVTLSTSPIRSHIQEWQPPGWGDASFVFGAVPLALAILLGGRTTLNAKLQSFPALVLFVAALFAFRNTALFAIVATPLAAMGLDARFPRLRSIGPKARELEPVALAAIALAVGLSALALTRLQRDEPARLPIAAIASLAADKSGHRLLCENFTWCSVALDYPVLRVFIDGRCDAYPLAVWQEYLTVIRGRDAWAGPLKAYRVDSVIAERGSTLAIALENAPRWESAYRDAQYVVFRHD